MWFICTYHCNNEKFQCVLLAEKIIFFLTVIRWDSSFNCCSLLGKSCLTFCNPMDSSPPGSSVHGISQARLLGWVTISFSRGYSHPRDQTQVPWLAGRFFTTEPPGKPLSFNVYLLIEDCLSSQGHGAQSFGLSVALSLWLQLFLDSSHRIWVLKRKDWLGSQKILLLGLCEFVLCDLLSF